ncbi:MAG TPA: hypothetical protein VM050_05165 [Patescibacteria group bacterium]|nr:hypothetical protein [Patescibacteria group bacterium]
MYKGIRRSYTLLVLFFIEVVKELGTDPTIEMLEKAIEGQADVIERELRREIPVGTPPLEAGVRVYRAFMEDAGAEVEVHRRDETSITFRVARCPFYEAFLDVGIDCGYFLGGLCTNLTLPAIRATLARFDPRLKLETVVVRETAEELCLEKIHLDEP